MSEACRSYPCHWPVDTPEAGIATITALTIRNGLHANLIWGNVHSILSDVAQERLRGTIRSRASRARLQSMCCYLSHALANTYLWKVSARMNLIHLSISDLVTKLQRDPSRRDTALTLQQAYIELRYATNSSFAELTLLSLDPQEELFHQMIDAFCDNLIHTICQLPIFPC